VRVLGLDPGGLTGWTILDFNGYRPCFVSGGAVAPDGLHSIDYASADWIAMEAVEEVYRRHGFGTQMATGIAGATRVEGRIIEIAKAKGLRLEMCTGNEWRRMVVGEFNDPAIRRMVLLRVDRLPKRTNVHMRDAMGTALFCYQRDRIQLMRRR
jgi:GNAT superfamily N-acetyltransferase